MNKASCKQLLTEFVLPLVFISLFFGVALAWPFDWLTEPTAATKTVPETKQDVKRPASGKKIVHLPAAYRQSAPASASQASSRADGVVPNPSAERAALLAGSAAAAFRVNRPDCPHTPLAMTVPGLGLDTGDASFAQLLSRGYPGRAGRIVRACSGALRRNGHRRRHRHLRMPAPMAPLEVPPTCAFALVVA